MCVYVCLRLPACLSNRLHLHLYPCVCVCGCTYNSLAISVRYFYFVLYLDVALWLKCTIILGRLHAGILFYDVEPVLAREHTDCNQSWRLCRSNRKYCSQCCNRCSAERIGPKSRDREGTRTLLGPTRSEELVVVRRIAVCVPSLHLRLRATAYLRCCTLAVHVP